MDKIQTTLEFATELTKEYLPDFSVRLSNLKNFKGRCNSYFKLIEISDWHIVKHSENDVLDTILHEIAHGLVGAGNGHNKKWQLKAQELGAIPRRYGLGHSDAEGNTWEKYCPNNCSRQKYKRKPKHHYADRCHNCNHTISLKRIYE